MNKALDNRNYDAIVIGSGMGGLTTASILAQLGKKRVLVLERHFKLGGFTHSFRRKRYEWDVGVHYIGDMQPESMTRGIMDLVTREGIQWHKMSSPFERFVFPKETFEVSDDEKTFQQDLIRRFPNEADKIKQYFKDLRRAQGWVARWFVSKQFSPFIASMMNYFGKSLPMMTTKTYLDRFEDPLLSAILAAQWPDFGTPPSESAFGFHATVAADFLQGGYFPVGGSKQIAIQAAAAIEHHGGSCLVNHEVKTIRVENGRVVGVTAINKGEEIEFNAPVIISNAGAVTTFGKLVPENTCSREREIVARLKPGTSAIILFLGLSDDPRKHGFDESNYWIYSRLDHDTQAKYRDGEDERIDGLFLSFGSLRNPGQEAHTAQLISFSDDKQWEQFSHTTWMRRGAEYEQTKERYAEAMLNYANERFPGLKEIVDHRELSTPLTVKSFTGHWAGGIYGQSCDANRLFRDQWRIKTSLKGLYLTGSDVGTPGVNGAMMAGVMTAAKLLGPLGLPRIFMRSHSLGKRKNSGD